LAAGLGDFGHHLVGRALGGDLAVAAGGGVVDDDLGAFPVHHHRNAATDATPRARDDAGLTFEVHGRLPFGLYFVRPFGSTYPKGGICVTDSDGFRSLRPDTVARRGVSNRREACQLAPAFT